MITMGLDCGSLYFKAVLLRDGEMITSRINETAGNRTELASRLVEEVITEAGLTREELGSVISTGRGRDLARQADANDSDISCIARAVHHLVPGADVIIDIGAESITTILNGDGGEARDFSRNDKCASGSGRFLEVLTSALGVSLEEIDVVAAQATKKALLSGQCGVFMESEVITLVNQGDKARDIVAGICDAVAKFAASQVLRLGSEGKFTVTGGVGRLSSVLRMLDEKLKDDLLPFPVNPQLAAAYGAALYGLRKG